MRPARHLFGDDRGGISILTNASLMVALSVLLFALPDVALLTAIIMLGITLVLIALFVGLVFDDQIPLSGSRFALASGLVLACLVVSFAGVYHAQSEANHRAFSHRLTRLGAIYFAIGTTSTSGTNGVEARSGGAQAELAVQQAVDFTALALLIGGLIRRLGSRGVDKSTRDENNVSPGILRDTQFPRPRCSDLAANGVADEPETKAHEHKINNKKEEP